MKNNKININAILNKLGGLFLRKKEKNRGQKKKGRFWYWFWMVLLTMFLIGFICAIIIGGAFVLYVANYIDYDIDIDMLSSGQDLTTKIYYMDYSQSEAGIPVELEDQRLHGSENRIWTDFEDIPEHVWRPFVAIEDHRFFTHGGVDWFRTATATFGFLTGLSDYGGSTITQQLVKNLTEDKEVTPQRKVKEILCALNIESKKSKNEILEMYLNTIYLSQGYYGLQTASVGYFNKNVEDLDLIEACALAAIINSPTYYDPILHPDHNKERRQDILYRMFELEMLTQEELDYYYDMDLELDRQEVTEKSTNSWFTDAVINNVIEDLMETYGYSYLMASQMLYTQGLEIYTTMDPEVQAILEEVFENEENFPAEQSILKPDSAMVVMNPKNGNIVGLVGGRGEKTQDRLFNLATMAKRSPGSSIKPITVYGPAIDAGLVTYGTVLDDVPFRFTQVGEGDAQRFTYWPSNYPNVFYGLTTVADGLQRSANTIAVRILDILGVNRSYDFAKNKAGLSYLTDHYVMPNGAVKSDLDYAPLALGATTVGVTVEQMTAAYSMFANNGIYSAPRTYSKVLDKNGDILLNNEVESNIVISEATASIMTKMMQNVVNYGTAAEVSLKSKINVAGKTGTADSDTDRWFVGYTPYYVSGIWFGYQEPKTLGNYSRSPHLYLWDLAMTKIHQKYIDDANNGGAKLKTFELAQGVVTATYCKDSGKLLSDACALDPRGSRAQTGYFTAATVPTETCDVHVEVLYDTSTNAVASSSCPHSSVKTIALVREVSRDFPVSFRIVDSEYMYRQLSADDYPAYSSTVPYYQTMIASGRYVGYSDDSPYNCFCYTHYTPRSDLGSIKAQQSVIVPEDTDDDTDNGYDSGRYPWGDDNKNNSNNAGNSGGWKPFG